MRDGSKIAFKKGAVELFKLFIYVVVIHIQHIYNQNQYSHVYIYIVSDSWNNLCPLFFSLNISRTACYMLNGKLFPWLVFNTVSQLRKSLRLGICHHLLQILPRSPGYFFINNIHWCVFQIGDFWLTRIDLSTLLHQTVSSN